VQSVDLGVSVEKPLGARSNDSFVEVGLTRWSTRDPETILRVSALRKTLKTPLSHAGHRFGPWNALSQSLALCGSFSLSGGCDDHVRNQHERERVKRMGRLARAQRVRFERSLPHELRVRVASESEPLLDLVETRIQESMREGEFEGPANEGRPLPNDGPECRRE